EAPAGMEALIGGIPFEEGGSYLITAYDGTVNYCGFSGPATADLRAAFDEAFGGGGLPAGPCDWSPGFVPGLLGVQRMIEIRPGTGTPVGGRDIGRGGEGCGRTTQVRLAAPPPYPVNLR